MLLYRVPFRLYLLFVYSLFLGTLLAQDAVDYKRYYPPKDSVVQKKLDWWKDIKFGLLMHWGPYSQWGVVESWSICSEDEGWTQRKGPYAKTYFEYLQAYEKLQTTFNPVKFNPERWATAAKNAGMKYVVFTTKHHDGFCMFDTKQTDYKITDAKTPFHTSPRSNVTKEIFNAFRKEGFGVGTYFSKPDWHCDDYWWRYFATPDRNVNYSPKKYPQKWNSYKLFTYNQIEELMRDYGNIDILWLDGGWVRPLASVDTSVEWQKTITRDQDIDMGSIAAMARKHQPGLIVVDRSVGGEFENYRTPEQEIPEKPLDHPWETCMTMASSWSYVPNDTYKSTRVIVHYLIDIVSKGGNYLLNIGPGPDGEWDPAAYQRLKEIGAWMKINGEAIYETEPIAPYKEKNICFTSGMEGKVYALFLAAENQNTMPDKIVWSGLLPKPGSKISLLGSSADLNWTVVDNSVMVSIPEYLRQIPPCKDAWVLSFEMR